MAKPNYAFQKRQRELAKKQKKEAKQKMKEAEKAADQPAEAGATTESNSPDDLKPVA